MTYEKKSYVRLGLIEKLENTILTEDYFEVFSVEERDKIEVLLSTLNRG